MKSFEFFEHTADVGLRVYGRDLAALFRHGGQGFYDLVTDWKKIRDSVDGSKTASLEKTLRLQAKDLSDLYLQWLRELLFLFSAQKVIFIEFEFQNLSEKKLIARCRGRKFDPARDEQRYEVKAITYHQYSMKKEPPGWVAEVIVDI